MQILVINAGSSSVKFSIFENRTGGLYRIIFAKAVRLFQKDAELSIYDGNKSPLIKQDLQKVTIDTVNHSTALEFFLGWLSQQSEIKIKAVGHRIVHGGPEFNEPVLITDKVFSKLESYTSLAPLHQPHNLAPIKIIQELYPHTTQIACFDTAFHQSMPIQAKQFAIPKKYYEDGVQRYGFHGLSYEYVLNQLQIDSEIGNSKIVIAHLGNGASMCAMQSGKSIATTMSFTPLDGLVMGTRCGDLDPGVVLYLAEFYKLTLSEISDLLYKKSGLLGLSDESNNMQKLLNSNSNDSKHAIDLFCHQVNRNLGMLVAELGGIDQFIFTAGIGENSAVIREKICQLAIWCGIDLNKEANLNNQTTISSNNSKVKVKVVPTNEAKMIANHTQRIYSNLH